VADNYTIRFYNDYWYELYPTPTTLSGTLGGGTAAIYSEDPTWAMFGQRTFLTSPSIFFFTPATGGTPSSGGTDTGGESPTIYSNCITGDEGDVDMEMYRGNQFTFDGFVRNQLSRERISLVGGVVIMTAKWDQTDADADAVFQLRSDDLNPVTITFAAPAEGEFTVSIPPSATSSLPRARCVLRYDIKFIDVDDHPYTVADGTLIVLPGVTDAQA